MPRTLLDTVLSLLDQIEAPLLAQREADRFPAEQLQALLSTGVLQETSPATEIPRPERFPGGGSVTVRRTSRGLYGVVEEDGYCDPVPLTEDDVRRYRVSLSGLVARLRRENDIEGRDFRNDGGLIPLGQKLLSDGGLVHVYLSLPNGSEGALLGRCQRLTRSAGPSQAVLITPHGVALSSEGRSVLEASGVTTAALALVAGPGSLRIDWNRVIPGAARANGVNSTAPKGAGIPVKDKRRRGFPANWTDHERVFAAARAFGEDWPSHLVEICEELEKSGAVFPAKWRKEEFLESWQEVADDYQEMATGAKKEKLVKYIQYRLDWVEKHLPGQERKSDLSLA